MTPTYHAAAKSLRHPLPFAVTAFAIAACSGNGGSAFSVPARVPATSAPTAAAAASKATTIQIRFPASGAQSSFRRKPNFVSPATNGVDISAYTSPESSNPAPVAHLTADLGNASTACSADAGGTRTCVVSLPIPAGTYDFTFVLYDQAPVNGSFSSAKELGTGSVTKTIVRNADNTVSVAVDGLIASLALAPGRQTFLPATAATFQLGVTALDADLDTVLAGVSDPYLNPVTISVSDTGSHMLLSLNGGTPAKSVTSMELSDRVTAVYDGAGSKGYSATVTASASGVGAASETLDSFTISTAYTNFTSYGATATVTVDEPHATGAFTTQSVACAGVATASSVTGSGEIQTFTITGASSNGTCNELVSNEDGSRTQRDFVNLYVPGPVPTDRLFVVAGSVDFAEYALNASTLEANVQQDNYVNYTTLKGAFGIARDSSGDVYVTDFYNQSVCEFAPTANDNMAPVNVISGGATGLSQPRLVRVDSAGNIYVMNSNGTITEYPPNSTGNVAPSRTISLSSLPGDTFYGLALDSAGNIYTTSRFAAGNNGVTYLFELPASTPSGPATAIRSITGPNTELGQPRGIFVDASGDAYVTSDTYDNFSEFGPAQSGNVQPIFSSAGELNQPAGIVVESDGTVITTGLTASGEYYVTYPPGQVHAGAQYGPLFAADSQYSDLSL